MAEDIVLKITISLGYFVYQSNDNADLRGKAKFVLTNRRDRPLSWPLFFHQAGESFVDLHVNTTGNQPHLS